MEGLDIFGRLPSDVLKHISAFYEAPTFDFHISTKCERSETCDLILKMNSFVIRFKMIETFFSPMENTGIVRYAPYVTTNMDTTEIMENIDGAIRKIESYNLQCKDTHILALNVFGVILYFKDDKLEIRLETMEMSFSVTESSLTSLKLSLLKLRDFLNDLLKDKFYSDKYHFSTNYSRS